MLRAENAALLAAHQRVQERAARFDEIEPTYKVMEADHSRLVARSEELDALRAERDEWRSARAQQLDEFSRLRAMEREHAQLAAEHEAAMKDGEELDVLRAEAAKWNAERSGLNVRIAELEGRLSPAVWVTRARGEPTRLNYTVADALRRKSEADGANGEGEATPDAGSPEPAPAEAKSAAED